MGAFCLKTEMKSAYALAFLGPCACVLVIHQNTDNSVEDTKQAVDPFLASIEAHVVAKAQRALRIRDLKEATHAHISEARKAIKASLLNAETSAIYKAKQVSEAEAQELVEATTTAKKTSVKKKKTYTWAELQRGDDVKNVKHTENKVGSLMDKLKSASHTKAAPKVQKTKKVSSAIENALLAAKSGVKANVKQQKEQKPKVVEEVEEDEDEDEDYDDDEDDEYDY